MSKYPFLVDRLLCDLGYCMNVCVFFHWVSAQFLYIVNCACVCGCVYQVRVDTDNTSTSVQYESKFSHVRFSVLSCERYYFQVIFNKYIVSLLYVSKYCAIYS